jgi:hypothetical protein
MNNLTKTLRQRALLLSAAWPAVGLALVACGDSSDLQALQTGVAQERIYAGDAVEEQSPFAHVSAPGNGSGTLLDKNHVLTAAHCVPDGYFHTGRSGNLERYTEADDDLTGGTFWSDHPRNADDMVATAISTKNRVYVWYTGRKVVAGYLNSWGHQVNSYRRTYDYSLPGGRQPSDIV